MKDYKEIPGTNGKYLYKGTEVYSVEDKSIVKPYTRSVSGEVMIRIKIDRFYKRFNLESLLPKEEVAKPKPKVTITEEELKELYITQNLSKAKCSVELGVSTATISRYLKKYKLSKKK